MIKKFHGAEWLPNPSFFSKITWMKGDILRLMQKLKKISITGPNVKVIVLSGGGPGLKPTIQFRQSECLLRCQSLQWHHERTWTTREWNGGNLQRRSQRSVSFPLLSIFPDFSTFFPLVTPMPSPRLLLLRYLHWHKVNVVGHWQDVGIVIMLMIMTSLFTWSTISWKRGDWFEMKPRRRLFMETSTSGRWNCEVACNTGDTSTLCHWGTFIIHIYRTQPDDLIVTLKLSVDGWLVLLL